MKLKLAALLFSQAAAQATQKPAPGYFCNEDVFKPNEISTPIAYTDYVKQLQIDEINKNYKSYCENLARHESDLALRPIGSDCTYKSKGDLNKACDSLKKTKSEMPDMWNERVKWFASDCAQSYSSQGQPVFVRP